MITLGCDLENEESNFADGDFVLSWLCSYTSYFVNSLGKRVAGKKTRICLKGICNGLVARIYGMIVGMYQIITIRSHSQ